MDGNGYHALAYLSDAAKALVDAAIPLPAEEVRISEHRDRPFRLIVTAHFANA